MEWFVVVTVIQGHWK